MVSISEVFEVKTWRRPAGREPFRQISTFQVFRGLQVHHLTLESIGKSSRRKICGVRPADFLRNEIFRRREELLAALGVYVARPFRGGHS